MNSITKRLILPSNLNRNRSFSRWLLQVQSLELLRRGPTMLALWAGQHQKLQEWLSPTQGLQLLHQMLSQNFKWLWKKQCKRCCNSATFSKNCQRMFPQWKPHRLKLAWILLLFVRDWSRQTSHPAWGSSSETYEIPNVSGTLTGNGCNEREIQEQNRNKEAWQEYFLFPGCDQGCGQQEEKVYRSSEETTWDGFLLHTGLPHCAQVFMEREEDEFWWPSHWNSSPKTYT